MQVGRGPERREQADAACPSAGPGPSPPAHPVDPALGVDPPRDPGAGGRVAEPPVEEEEPPLGAGGSSFILRVPGAGAVRALIQAVPPVVEEGRPRRGAGPEGG